ncbi:MAG: hypothetical protein JST25_12875 [Actinobacteria bacterium]|nr:hypothetical protein [Actinomycetota bacterium]
MTLETNLNADQAVGSTVTWDRVRYMSGASANITDITITSRDADGVSHESVFAFADYRIGLYWRSGANSMLVASRVLRKYWGQNTGFLTIGSVQYSAYSLQTELVGAYDSNGSPLYYGWTPWVSATFDLSY